MMKKTTIWKRMLALGMCGIMTLALSACGGKDDDGEGDGSGTLKSSIDDSVVDMGGYEFTIASEFLVDDPNPSEITAAEAIFEEVRHKVEEDYNCKITILALENSIENVRTKVLAQDKIADIIDVQGFDIIPMARAGYIIPLDNVDGMDITDSRYIQGYTGFTEFNENHYGVNFMRPAEARFAMMYNRELLKECGITEDPQDLMKEGTWNYDKFREMCKTLTRDTNGDGQNDSYGCYVDAMENFGLSMISANNGRLVTTEGGVAKESYNSSQVLTALNYVYDLLNTDKTVTHAGNYEGGYISEKDAIARFVAGEYGFFYGETWLINQYLKPTCGDLDYGLLALPKGPDAKEYVSPSENARNFCITSTNKDIDKTITILNAIARYTEEYGGADDPDWWHYDLEMDYFQEGDTKSVEVYLTLLDHATLDLGVGVTDLWTNFKSTVIWDSCYQNKGTPASRIESISGKYQSAVDAIYN